MEACRLHKFNDFSLHHVIGSFYPQDIVDVFRIYRPDDDAGVFVKKGLYDIDFLLGLDIGFEYQYLDFPLARKT